MCCLSNKEINTRQKFRRDELTKSIMHSASKTLSSHSKEKYPRCYFFSIQRCTESNKGGEGYFLGEVFKTKTT